MDPNPHPGGNVNPTPITKRRGDALTLSLGQLLVGAASDFTDTLRLLIEARDSVDSLPARTLSDGMPRGSSDDTSVERALDRRYEYAEGIDQLQDDREAVRQVVASFIHTINHYRGVVVRPVPEAKLCDGAGIAGAHLEWTPHARGEDNGWRDPQCTGIATHGPLCARCSVRAGRWRRERGLPPLAGSEPQEGVA